VQHDQRRPSPGRAGEEVGGHEGAEGAEHEHPDGGQQRHPKRETAVEVARGEPGGGDQQEDGEAERSGGDRGAPRRVAALDGQHHDYRDTEPADDDGGKPTGRRYLHDVLVGDRRASHGYIMTSYRDGSTG